MIEQQEIINNLVFNEPYARKVFPYLKDEYFTEVGYQVVFGMIRDYTMKYNGFPNKTVLAVELEKLSNINEGTFKRCQEILIDVEKNEEVAEEWLVDTTEKFCQERAVYLAITKTMEIYNDKNAAKGDIPKVLSDALSVSFDSHIGHDFIEDSDKRFEEYHKRLDRIPFDLEIFNKITGGGLVKKSLTVGMAPTGVGKSLFMCHVAAAALAQGFNVLYITLEMAEERIAERIDANLLDVTIDDLKIITKSAYDSKMNKLKSNITGKLIIKEYPPASAHAGHFRHLINELSLKKKFKPDILIIDYLNICTSARIKAAQMANSYTLVKSIAEELRGLAVEFNVPVLTCTQTNRAGSTNSDLGMEHTSDSFGLPMTADLFFALTTSEELDKLGQIMIKQLKNRYSDPNMYRRFTIGVDKSKMRLYDTDQEILAEVKDNDDDLIMDARFGSERKLSKGFDDFK